jgi:hypothetical protein
MPPLIQLEPLLSIYFERLAMNTDTLESPPTSHSDLTDQTGNSLTTEDDWKRYLGIIPEHSPSQDQSLRLALVKLFHQYALEGRRLFHLTVTYKEYRDTPYDQRICNQFFINFYLKSFLPSLLSTRDFHLPSKRALQPICYAFIDEHESKPKIRKSKVEFPIRLHHHALLAVPAQTCERLTTMIGTNVIPLRPKFASKVMTTHMRKCEPMTMLYASKRLRQYPDFLAFPDRLSH